MEAVTLSPWEIVKLLWNSVDTLVAVGAAFFVGRYYSISCRVLLYTIYALYTYCAHNYTLPPRCKWYLYTF
jgi:hypothetical protein